MYTIIIMAGIYFFRWHFCHPPQRLSSVSSLPCSSWPQLCHYCLCSPCVIELPPDFLRGYCSPHPANDKKRHRLYRLFWALLNTLGVWRDDEYLQMKESRTSMDDRREFIPKCIITVSTKQTKLKLVSIVYTHRRYEHVIQVVMDSTGTTCLRLKQNLLWNYNIV